MPTPWFLTVQNGKYLSDDDNDDDCYVDDNDNDYNGDINDDNLVDDHDHDDGDDDEEGWKDHHD